MCVGGERVSPSVLCRWLRVGGEESERLSRRGPLSLWWLSAAMAGGKGGRSLEKGGSLTFCACFFLASSALSTTFFFAAFGFFFGTFFAAGFFLTAFLLSLEDLGFGDFFFFC